MLVVAVWLAMSTQSAVPDDKSNAGPGLFVSKSGRRARKQHKAMLEQASSVAAQWAVPDEESKAGAGLLFFAYGGSGEVDKFLKEATFAAGSFKRFNPSLNIAIVTNNKTVDPRIFSHHIRPRNELLFPGSPCPDVCRGDQLSRQWTTRLYYMALSPFEITWAFDSGVTQCPGPFAHNAVQRFLDDALASSLWGFDLGHANQAKGTSIYPHNFNLLYRWTATTSNVFRDWFLIQLRRGITTNDQDPLSLAEVRQKAAGGLRVGQVPTEFAGAFYSPIGGAFYPRITRVVHGPAQVLHVGPESAPAWCDAFNVYAGSARQMVVQDATALGRPITLRINDGHAALMDGKKQLFAGSTSETCRTALRVGPKRAKCPYQIAREISQMRHVQDRPRLIEAELPTNLNIRY